VALTDEWRKSSKSTATGGCVEARKHGAKVQVRDTKLGESSPVLEFTEHEWNSFLHGVHANEFSLNVLPN
jgi:hypothetical protein